MNEEEVFVSFSISPTINSNNNILIYAPLLRNTQQFSQPTSPQKPQVIDALTSMSICSSSRPICEIGQYKYDAELLAEIILNIGDIRNPVQKTTFKKNDLLNFSAALKEKNQFLSLRIKEFAEQPILPIKTLPIETLYVKYFEDAIATKTIQIIALCEKDANLIVENKSSESILKESWYALQYFFCGLLQLHPLKAVKCGSIMIKKFTEIVEDFFGNDEYNITMLLAVCGCVKKLVEHVNTGVITTSTKESITNIARCVMKTNYFNNA